MQIIDILSFVLMGFALAADASSVSLVYGSKFQPFKWKQAIIPAAAFGIAQGIMPVIGWFGGELVADLIRAVDHWVAFGCLLLIGGKFIWDSFHEEEVKVQETLKPWPIFLAALATSIDACAVGFTLSMTQNPIVIPALIFTVVTFGCSILCCKLGAKLGEKMGPRFMLVGGIVLIGIGVKILIEHLFFGG